MDNLAVVDSSIIPWQLNVSFASQDHDGGDFLQYGNRRGFRSLSQLINVHEEHPDLFE